MTNCYRFFAADSRQNRPPRRFVGNSPPCFQFLPRPLLLAVVFLASVSMPINGSAGPAFAASAAFLPQQQLPFSFCSLLPRSRASLGAASAPAEPSSSSSSSSSSFLRTTLVNPDTNRFELAVDLPGGGESSKSDAENAAVVGQLQAILKVEPLLDVPSCLVEVRYQVPFDLNVEPRKNLAVCTLAGKGGERPGDILRYTSQFTLGLPRQVGLGATAAAFAGGLQWQCSLFDVMKAAKWEQVVLALTSNTAERTDEVLLIFERAL